MHAFTGPAPVRVGHQHSLSLGEPRKEYRDIADVCEESYKKGHNSLQPGTKFSEVERAFRSPCEEAGMAYVELGCVFHPCHTPTILYPPDMFSNWVDKVMPYKVKAGMLCTHNIDIYNPKWKESILHYGDTTLVTDNGPRKMTKVPVELTII